MAYPTSIDFRRPSSQLSIDRKPGPLFDDLESLDNSMMDSAMLSPTTTDRRDSFGNSTAPYFSPQSTPWEDDFPNSATILPERHFNPFTEQSNNPFTRVESSSFGHNASPWPMVDRTTNSQTPVATTAYEGFSSEFDVAPPSAFSDVTSAGPAFGGLPMQGNVQPSAVFPPSAAPAQFETSPTDTKDWMSFAEQHAAVGVRHIPKRMRNDSPPRSYSPFHKRDGGIKKKTARFDIPPERSLDNIDDFIAKCTDEDQLKELKMQKRLLRNRQAALDSRQRKKQHAEDLANQNNAKAEVINHLEEELRNLTLQSQAEKDHFIRERGDFCRKIDQLELEKENMVRSHTLETGELRKKIGILTDRLNESGTNTLSHSHSDEFVDFTNEINSLTMATEWDDYTFINDINVDGEIQPPQNQTTIVVPPRKKESVADSEQPVASGLLLMLLLCGAFVASRSSGSTPPPAIKMPDEVREASTTILETVFKDAGVTPSQSSGSNAVVKLESTPSGAAWSKTSILANTGFNSIASTSNLDGLTNQFIAPTKDQEAEQAFSLSAQQYSSLTSTDFTRTVYLPNDEDSPLTPQSSQSSGGHRRNLAETLKAMRDEAKGQSAADVYTRSLLWDRIPTEVVHQFKRMVEESNALSAQSAGGG